MWLFQPLPAAQAGGPATVDATLLGDWGGLTSDMTATVEAVVSATMLADWCVTADQLATEAGDIIGTEDGLDLSAEGTPFEFAAMTATVIDASVDATMLGSWGALTAEVVADVTVLATGLGDWAGLTGSMIASKAIDATALGDWGGLTAAATAFRTVSATAEAVWGGLSAAASIAVWRGATMLGNWASTRGSTWDWHMQGPGPRRRAHPKTKIEVVTGKGRGGRDPNGRSKLQRLTR